MNNERWVICMCDYSYLHHWVTAQLHFVPNIVKTVKSKKVPQYLFSHFLTKTLKFSHINYKLMLLFCDLLLNFTH